MVFNQKYSNRAAMQHYVWGWFDNFSFRFRFIAFMKYGKYGFTQSKLIAYLYALINVLKDFILYAHRHGC